MPFPVIDMQIKREFLTSLALDGNSYWYMIVMIHDIHDIHKLTKLVFSFGYEFLSFKVRLYINILSTYFD